MGTRTDAGSTADAKLVAHAHLIAGTVDAIPDRTHGYAHVAIDAFVLNDLYDWFDVLFYFIALQAAKPFLH